MNVNSVSTQPDETVVYDGHASDGSQLAGKRTEEAAQWTRWIRLDSSPHSPCVAFKVSHKGDDRIEIHVLYLKLRRKL